MVLARFAHARLPYSTDAAQLQRLMTRDGLSEEDARNRINAQLPLDAKRRVATVVVENDQGLEELHASVRRVVQQWRHGRMRTWLWWLALAGPAAIAALAVATWTAFRSAGS